MQLTIFGKKIPVIVLVFALVVAGAGAAAGITLAGNISGEQTTEVDQAVVLDDINYQDNKPNTTLISSDQTEFSAAVQVYQGDQYWKNFSLTHNGQQEINARFTLEVDKPLQVELESLDEDNVSVQRVSMNEWILTIDNDVDSDEVVQMTVAAPNDIEPGFYDMEGVLRPVEV